MSFTSIPDIQRQYPINFSLKIVEPFLIDILKIFNGHVDFTKCEEDSSGILYLNTGHYFFFVCDENETALKCYRKAYDKKCIGSFTSIAMLTDDNDEKINLYEKYLLERPDSHISLYKNLFLCYSKRNNPNDKDRMVEIGLQLISRKEPSTILRFALFCLEDGELDLARKYHDKAKEIFENDIVYQSNLNNNLEECDKLLFKLMLIEENRL